eukprot:tig00020800_g13732.t1
MGRRRGRRVCPAGSSEDEGAPARAEKDEAAGPAAAAPARVKSEPGAGSDGAGTTFVLMNRGRSRAAVYTPMAADAEGAGFAAYTAITTRRVKLQLRDASGAALGRWAGRPLTVSLRYEVDGAAVLSASGLEGTGDATDMPLLFFEGTGDGRRCRACRLTLDPAGLSHEAFAILAPRSAPPRAAAAGGARLTGAGAGAAAPARGAALRAARGGAGAPPVLGRILIHTRTHALPGQRPARSESPAPVSKPRASSAAGRAPTTKRVRRTARRAQPSPGRASTVSPSLSASSGGEVPGSVPIKLEDGDEGGAGALVREARWGGTESSSESDISLDSDEGGGGGGGGGGAPHRPGPGSAFQAPSVAPAPAPRPDPGEWFTITELKGVAAAREAGGACQRQQELEDEEPAGAAAGRDVLDCAVDLIEANLSHIAVLSLEDGADAEEASSGQGPAAGHQWLSLQDAWRVAPWARRRGPPAGAPGRLAAAEAAALVAAFDAARAPGALASPPGVLRLLSILKDPRLLCTDALVTPEGRHSLRRAFHDLRETGAYAAVGVAAESLAAGALAMPDDFACAAEAGAALEGLYGLLTAASTEAGVAFPDHLYLPWPACSRLLRKAAAVVEPWARAEPLLRCRLLYQRSLALFHHGFWESALEEAFAAWSELIRAQLTPSRFEAALLRHITEMLLYLGKVEQARHLSSRLYFFDTPAPADRFMKALVLHLLSMIESSVNKRLEEGLALVTRAIEALEGLHPVYRDYASRSMGNRAVLYSQTGRVLQANREMRRSFEAVAEVSEAWSIHWSSWSMLRWWWCHPPEAAAEVRTRSPVSRAEI